MLSKQLLLPSAEMLFAVLFGGCKKDLVSLTSEQALTSAVITNTTIKRPVTGIDLGVAGNFVILSKSGITDVYKSTITGDVGSSSITGAAILLTCARVT